jgi:hypothetical protein
MAYTAGDTILDDEYNTFVNSSSSPFGYNHFAGTGSLTYGLGQSSISTVTAGDTINASHWNTLFTGMDNIANHVNIVLTTRLAVSAGDPIEIAAAVATDLASLATEVNGGSTGATALTTSSALQTATTGSEGWDNTATQEVSATFTNANEMRYFFNAGGKIRVTVGTSAASTSAKDTAFAALGTALGNLDIAAQASTRSGASQSLTTNGFANGFYDLGTSYTTICLITQNAYAAYNSNTLKMEAKLDAAPGSSTKITIKMTASDPAADTQYPAGNGGGVPTDVKNTPKMVTTLFTVTPNTSNGLATAYGVSSTAVESNGTT